MILVVTEQQDPGYLLMILDRARLCHSIIASPLLLLKARVGSELFQGVLEGVLNE